MSDVLPLSYGVTTREVTAWLLCHPVTIGSPVKLVIMARGNKHRQREKVEKKGREQMWSCDSWRDMLQDSKLSPHHNRALRSSSMLRSACWYLFTDVSRQLVSPVFKGQAVQIESSGSSDVSWTAWPLKMEPIGCTETSVNNYTHTFCNSPEHQRA